MRLEAPADFDFDWTLGFLAARVVASLESLEDGEYRRSLRVDGRPVALAIRVEPGELTVRSSPRLPAAELRRLVTRMFDLDVEMDAFHSSRPRILFSPAWSRRAPGSACRSISIRSRAPCGRSSASR